MEDKKGQILLYQTPDGEARIEVRLQGETVWLSLEQMAELFQRNKSTISRHIKNVFEQGELEKTMVVAKFATTTQHGEEVSDGVKENMDVALNVAVNNVAELSKRQKDMLKIIGDRTSSSEENVAVNVAVN